MMSKTWMASWKSLILASAESLPERTCCKMSKLISPGSVFLIVIYNTCTQYIDLN